MVKALVLSYMLLCTSNRVLDAGDSMDGVFLESGGGPSGGNLGGPEDEVQQQQPEDNSQVDGTIPHSPRNEL